MPKLLGFTQSGFDPASRFRFIQFIPYLEKAGWTIDHRPNRPDRQWQSPLRGRITGGIHYRAARLLMKGNRVLDATERKRADAIFVNRDFAGEGRLLQRVFLPTVRKAVFDFDDAIFIGSREKNVRWMCENAFWVTPGNEYLAKYARQFTDRVTVLPTVIDTENCRTRFYCGARPNGLLRVGWSGSDQSIDATLVPYLTTLARLQKQIDFELVVITNSKPTLPIPDLRWRFYPWKKEDECSLESKFDIGIMPLADNEFQKGKCALKLLQYMAAGLPTVASPVGVNSEVVKPGVTGFLARNENDWHEALRCLLGNAAMRASMGVAGRRRCEKHYSIHRWLPTLIELFEKIRFSQRHS